MSFPFKRKCEFESHPRHYWLLTEHDIIFPMETPRDRSEFPELEKFLEKWELQHLHYDVLGRIVTLVIAAMGLIAALAWDEALRHIFDTFFTTKGTILEEVLYAVIITIIVALISVRLGKSFRKNNKK